MSLGDFVLLGRRGGPALAVIEATARLLPGVLGNEQSATDESHAEGLLEYPQYTRPEEFRGEKVPDVLRSGNHAAIARWRRKESLRPDVGAAAGPAGGSRALEGGSGEFAEGDPGGAVIPDAGADTGADTGTGTGTDADKGHPVNPINLALRFFLEVIALGAIGWWGWGADGLLVESSVWRLWSFCSPQLFGALSPFPTTPSRGGSGLVQVPGIARLALELLVFGGAAYALRSLGRPHPGDRVRCRRTGSLRLVPTNG